MHSQFLLFLASLAAQITLVAPAVISSNTYGQIIETRGLWHGSDGYSNSPYPRSDLSELLCTSSLGRRTPIQPKPNPKPKGKGRKEQKVGAGAKHDRESSSSSGSVAPPSPKRGKLDDEFVLQGFYTTPVDLLQQQGAEQVIQEGKSYNWYSRVVYLEKPVESIQLTKLAKIQAQHLVGQGNFKTSNHPNDMTAIYVPLKNDPRGAAVVSFATNLRFDKTCRPPNTRAAEIENTGPGMSTEQQTSLSLVSEHPKNNALKQGPHGEWVCIDELTTELGIPLSKDGLPQFPAGSMTISFLLKDPTQITPQSSCNGAQHDCATKIEKMNLSDVHGLLGTVSHQTKSKRSVGLWDEHRMKRQSLENPMVMEDRVNLLLTRLVLREMIWNRVI